jgi:hypothetical protein
MEEIKHHSFKSLQDLNSVKISEEFISETDRMLHKMCNLGFDTTTNSRANKSTKTSEAYKQDVYYETAYDNY